LACVELKICHVDVRDPFGIAKIANDDAAPFVELLIRHAITTFGYDAAHLHAANGSGNAAGHFKLQRICCVAPQVAIGHDDIAQIRKPVAFAGIEDKRDAVVATFDQAIRDRDIAASGKM
jgi:hypothetical protein